MNRLKQALLRRWNIQPYTPSEGPLVNVATVLFGLGWVLVLLAPAIPDRAVGLGVCGGGILLLALGLGLLWLTV